MITTVLWDNDGILVDTEKLFFQATREALKPIGIDLTEALYIQFYLQSVTNPFCP